MPHDTPLIATLAIGLGFAFILGVLAQRLRLSPIIGYLVAGIAVGPFTPGYVADQKLAVELAEIGVILLMFGVGLHFSLKDLLLVRAIAIPGAIVQIITATVLGVGLAWLLGWGPGAGVIFALALSVASTVVLLRALQERRQIESGKGRIAVGWLIVEDLVMVLALVLVPPLSGLLGGNAPGITQHAGLVVMLGIGPIWLTLLLTMGKVGVFVLLMLVVGRRLIPAILHDVAHTGSRELFRLSVLAIALGVAYGAAQLFGVSFALGAFFAGMILAESPLSQQAARETLPLRDAFAVLFFVSVGMLFNPAILLTQPLAILGSLLIIMVGKSVAAYAIMRLFRYPRGVALTIAASLAQIGEFSFILIVLGVNLAIVPEAARDLVVAGAILSIVLNPLMFALVDRVSPEPALAPRAAPAAEAPKPAGHTVLVGHGRVGQQIAQALQQRGEAFLIVESDEATLQAPRAAGVETHAGACGEEAMLPLLRLGTAQRLILTIPDPYEAGHMVEAARAANPGIRIIARAQNAEAATYLQERGANIILTDADEVAKGMVAAL